MSVVATQASAPALPDGATSTPLGLELPDGLRFNEWRRLGERFGQVLERSLWTIGDWRAYGDRFGVDYADALAAIDRADETIRRCAWVARSFAGERRRASLSFSHHESVASLSEAEQELWLNECERQGWGRAELRERLSERKLGGPRPPALSVRAVGDVVARFESRAAALGVPVRALALDVLELASTLEDPVAVLEAAGATRTAVAVAA